MSRNKKARKIKKIFQWQEYLSWKKMTSNQKLNFKRACLFPILAYLVFRFLSDFTYSILLIIGIYFLIRIKNKNKIIK